MCVQEKKKTGRKTWISAGTSQGTGDALCTKFSVSVLDLSQMENKAKQTQTNAKINRHKVIMRGNETQCGGSMRQWFKVY